MVMSCGGFVSMTLFTFAGARAISAISASAWYGSSRTPALVQVEEENAQNDNQPYHLNSQKGYR